MAKFTEKEIEMHKRFLTISDMKEVANENVVWETIRNALYGINHYDTGNPEKLVAIEKLRELIRNRATKALEVIGAEVVSGRE